VIRKAYLTWLESIGAGGRLFLHLWQPPELSNCQYHRTWRSIVGYPTPGCCFWWCISMDIFSTPWGYQGWHSR